MDNATKTCNIYICIHDYNSDLASLNEICMLLKSNIYTQKFERGALAPKSTPVYMYVCMYKCVSCMS